MIVLYSVLSCFPVLMLFVSALPPYGQLSSFYFYFSLQQQLQFSDSPRSVSAGASSQFPQQPHKATPARRSARNPDTSTPSSLFPWERDDGSSVSKGRVASSVAPSNEVIPGGLETQGDCGMVEDLRKERDGEGCFALPNVTD